MNKVLILALITCSLAFVCAKKQGPYGGFTEMKFDPKNPIPAVLVAQKYLQQHLLANQNDIPVVQRIMQKIVSGMLYKIEFQNGTDLYEVQVWSQPWMHMLKVQSAVKINPTK